MDIDTVMAAFAAHLDKQSWLEWDDEAQDYYCSDANRYIGVDEIRLRIKAAALAKIAMEWTLDDEKGFGVR
jgi:hypothetical protein